MIPCVNAGSQGEEAERYRGIHLGNNPDYSQFIAGEGIAVITISVQSARICNVQDKVRPTCGRAPAQHGPGAGQGGMWDLGWESGARSVSAAGARAQRLNAGPGHYGYADWRRPTGRGVEVMGPYMRPRKETRCWRRGRLTAWMGRCTGGVLGQ
jgi:hypothetical protein